MPGVFMYVHMLKNGILKKELKTKQNQKLQGQPEGGKKWKVKNIHITKCNKMECEQAV